MLDVPDLTEALTSRVNASGEPVMVVALDGPSGAGKTTLAEHLAARLGAVTLHMDDFYRDEPEAERLLHDASSGMLHYFDWQRLRDEALQPLLRGETAVYRPFDWARGHGLGAPVKVVAASVVLLEGVYSARAELRDLIDVSVMVTATEDTRQRRRRLRHDPHEWERRWDAAEQQYFGGLHDFDYVVDCG